MSNTYFLTKKMKYTIALLCMFLCFMGVSRANPADVQQQNAVTGTIVDDAGLPLIGVTVSIVGTTTGTISDIDGNYSIAVPNPKTSLQYSFIGFVQQNIVVGDKSVINVKLLEDLQNLEEVVVVGYGVQKKSHLTGSITKVRTEGLEDIPSSRLDQALQGRVAGVSIQNISAEVGDAPQIRVRGMGSMSASSSPLVIVDGFPVDEGLGVVNMNDVESIEILKDAASAAIYGSRAANGVIMITTKSGTVDKAKYTLKTSWGVKEAYKLHDIMTAKEFVAKRVDEAKSLGIPLSAQEFAYSVIDNDTDWQKEGTRTANIYNVQLGVSGGKKELKYYVSGSYSNDQGIMPNNEYKKINVRSKIDAVLSKRVKMGINIAPTYTMKTSPATNFIDFYRTPSFLPVRHTAATAALTKYPEGSYAHGAHFNNVIYTGIDPLTGLERSEKTSPFNTANHNPKSLLENESINQKDYRLQTSAYLDINIIKGLDFRTSNGIDIAYRDYNSYRNKEAKKDGETSRALYQNRLLITMLSENTLTYSTKIDKKHDISVMGGFSYQARTTKTAGILGVDFATDQIHTLGAAGQIMQYEGSKAMTGTWKDPYTLTSAFGRVAYSYEDRYLLSATNRADRSSRFGEDNRWGWFPSLSLGWRASEERFIKDNLTWVDQLKFRTSYGVTGTDEIPSFANMNLLDFTNYSLGDAGTSISPGLSNANTTLGNIALKWEQTNESNVGVDLSVFNNRLGLVIDMYYSKTKSLLYETPINSASGSLKKWTNQGKVRNKGIEIEVTTYNVNDKDLKWNTSFNFSANKNKVLDIGGPFQIINQGERTEMYVTQVGGPSVQFWGFKTVGVWETTEQLETNAKHITDKVGGLRVQNTNGDNVIDEKDMVALGDPFPDFTWGITNNVKYKGFDLSVLVQGVEGIDVWNGDEFYTETRRWNADYVKNRWFGEAEGQRGDGKTPYESNGINHMMTDYAIQDGSYIALRDVTIGYTLPAKTIKKLGFGSMRIYASFQNLGYWMRSDYKGINPEARMTSNQYASPLISGYQRGSYPLQRTYNFGFDLTF